MKKILVFVCFTLPLLAFSLAFTFAPASAKDPIIDSINEKLEAIDPYYQKGSVHVKDFADLTMDVAINEEDIEEQKVKVVFVRYQIDRDTIFHFNKQEIFYYSLDQDALLENDMVIGNEQSKAFINDHQDDYRKQITPLSLALILTFIFSAILVFPLVVLILQKNAPSDESYPYQV
ncbi:hypothetical protein D3H55_12640 [Bacillus salacetis]|uniref:Type VII secretion protein EssA n=1 Tax=Bacillus salacetis TaxID=2315464 RepID=A0A3A1QZZ3_9BACI|nr:hypothetical protein [Bacillus salacetis]RIW32722.1 hypothetical protein D3H55_12640 [Bacillus salacetis]